jgi:hypothetical protein
MIERRGASHLHHQQHHRQPSFRDCAQLGLCFRAGAAAARHELRCETELRRDALDADGIICDIGRSLDLLKTVLAEFYYRSLDEFAEFRGRNTTREFLACEVHKRQVRRIEEGALGSQANTSLRVVLREKSSSLVDLRRPLG